MVDRYEFQVSGRLDQVVRDELATRVTALDDSSGTLVADVQDQAALLGLMATLESLGVEIVSVEQLPAHPDQNGHRRPDVTGRPGHGTTRRRSVSG